MREAYEYAVIDVTSFRKKMEQGCTMVAYGEIDCIGLRDTLNDLGSQGFRIVTIVEDVGGKLILMSKAGPKI